MRRSTRVGWPESATPMPGMPMRPGKSRCGRAGGISNLTQPPAARQHCTAHRCSTLQVGARTRRRAVVAHCARARSKLDQRRMARVAADVVTVRHASTERSLARAHSHIKMHVQVLHVQVLHAHALRTCACTARHSSYNATCQCSSPHPRRERSSLVALHRPLQLLQSLRRVLGLVHQRGAEPNAAVATAAHLHACDVRSAVR